MVWTAKPPGQEDLQGRIEMLCCLLVRCDPSINDLSFLFPPAFSRYQLQCGDERVVVRACARARVCVVG